MIAIRVVEFGGPEVLRCQEVADPVSSGDQVLVKVHAVGVNPVEAYIRSGSYARLPALPYTPGSDVAGVVVSTGQRVYLSGTLTGGYAEFCLAEPRHVHSLPERWSFAQGAALGVPYATAYQALFHKATIKAGQRVLVKGASGSVGLAAVQLAKAVGCWVAGTASTEEGRALVSGQGADHVSGHNELEGPYDVILETHANTGLEHDLEHAARRGVIVIVGNRGRIEIDPRQTMAKDLTIHGLALANATPQEHAAIHAGLAECEGVKPVIRAEYPLSDAPRAHKEVMERGAAGKIVLIP